MKISIAIALLAVAASAQATPVTLKSGKQVETGLAESRLIAELMSPSRQIYLLIAGRDCIECDENTSLYLGRLEKNGLPQHWSDRRNDYPGVVSDYESKEPMQKVRAFFGHCISDTSDQVVWFIDFPTDSGNAWTTGGEYLTTLDDGGPKIDITQDRQPHLSNVLSQVKHGDCHEIPGIDTASEP